MSLGQRGRLDFRPAVQREPIVDRRFINMIAGPRQVGKTTIAQGAAARCGLPYLYASADGPSPPQARWIDEA